MITTCTHCGKKFSIDPAKLPGPAARFTCSGCGQVITVNKSDTAPQTPAAAGADTGTSAAPRPAAETSGEKIKTEGLSIRSKITLIIVALVVLALAVAGFIASYQSRDALSRQAEEHLVSTAKLKASEYALTFERIREEVQALREYAAKAHEREDIQNDIGLKILMPWDGSGYGNPVLEELLGAEKQVLQRIGLVLQSVVSQNPYLSLGYFGSETGMTVFDNEPVVDVIEDLEAFDVTQRPWYLLAKKEKGVIWTEPYVDANTKKLVVTCAAPVYRKNGGDLIGVVGFDVLLDTIQEDILTMDIGYDSYAFLVNSKGLVLVRPGMQAADARWDATYKTENLLETENPAFNTIVGEMIKGRSSVDVYDARDETKYTAYAPLKAIGASMGIVASRDEVIKPAVTLQYIIIGVFIVVLLIAIIVGLLVGNNITKPINELTLVADAISQGKRDLEVLEENRKDEIGVLTKAFNRLVISLKVAMSR